MLVVKGIDLRTYNRRFQELKILCPSMVPDLEKTLEKYVEGLPRSIEGDVTSSNPPTLEAAMKLAQRLLDQEVKCNELKRKLDNKRITTTTTIIATPAITATTTTILATTTAENGKITREVIIKTKTITLIAINNRIGNKGLQ